MVTKLNFILSYVANRIFDPDVVKRAREEFLDKPLHKLNF